MAHLHTAKLDLYYPDMTVPVTETIRQFAQGEADNALILDNLADTDIAEIIVGAWSFNGIANGGLGVLDTDASHSLIITPGSNLTANRILTITTGDAARTLTLGGNVSFTSGLLVLANGGTNANLTASNGGIVYSTASALAILSGVAATGKMVRSVSGGAPVWSTPTYPNVATLGKILIGDGTNVVESTPKYPNASATAGKIIRSDGTDYASSTSTFADTYSVSTILYASSANVVAGLTTGNSGVLVTSGGGVPSISTDLPTAVTIGSAYIYRASGTDVPVADGGTGLSTIADGSILVANTADTLSALTWHGAGTKMLVNTSGVLSMESVTGSGAPVLATTPTLVTPVLGVATATSIAIGANILDTVEWAILDGITANKTIDHSTVSIINGNGITGGDNLTASRTIALTILTSDWDIGDGRMIQTDKIRARDADGLSLFEDGGKGIFIKDGGVGIGLGTTDVETWVSMTTVLESLDTSIAFGVDTDLHVTSNAYYDGAWKYRTTDYAANYYLYKGAHYWGVATTGTINNEITWIGAMTIGNSGGVHIGGTSDVANDHLTVDGGIQAADITATTGGVTINGGGNLTLAGGDASGEGNIVMSAAVTIIYDTNLLLLDDNTKTIGFIASSTPNFSAVNGPYFGARGNSYTTFGSQQGILFFCAGYIAGMDSNEGEIRFLTSTGSGDTMRMVIKNTGCVGINTSAPSAQFAVNGGVHVGGDSDPGDNNLLVDGTFKVAGNSGFYNTAPVAQPTGIAAQKINYTAGDLDTEAEIISAINTTNTAINALRTALNALGLTTIV